MRYDYARPRPNPPITVGTGLGLLVGVGATLAGALAAKALLERRMGAAKRPSSDEAVNREVDAVLSIGATVGSAKLAFRFPVAFNTLGLTGVDGPTQAEFPYVTQPSTLRLRGRDASVIPLRYLYARARGEVGFAIDEAALLAAGHAENLESQATYADGSPQGATAQVDALLVDISPGLANHAMEEGLRRVREAGDAFDVPSGTRDAFVRMVLSSVVPSYDWSQAPLRSGEWDPRLRAIWDGVDLVAQLAYQRAWLERG